MHKGLYLAADFSVLYATCQDNVWASLVCSHSIRTTLYVLLCNMVLSDHVMHDFSIQALQLPQKKSRWWSNAQMQSMFCLGRTI